MWTSVQWSSVTWSATVGALAALFLSPLPAAGKPVSAAFYVARCNLDAEITAAERDRATDVALDFVHALANGMTDQAYAALSEEFQSKHSNETMAKFVVDFKSRNFSPDIVVSHLYRIKVLGRPAAKALMPCGGRVKDLDKINLSIKDKPEQFYVDMIAHEVNTDWSIIIRLDPEDKILKIVSFNWSLEAIAGRSALDFQKMAEVQHSRGHDFNAALLYKVAELTTQRGPDASPVWKGALDKEVQAFQWPASVRGDTPNLWPVGDTQVPVLSLAVLGVDGNLQFGVRRKVEDWPDVSARNKENGELLTNITKTYPEIKDVFSSIIIQYYTDDGLDKFNYIADLSEIPK